MRKVIIPLIISLLIGLLLYTVVGTSGNVSEIKKRVPIEVKERNWTILRYEGYGWSSWYKHGGYCCYHICNTDNHSIQYRVNVSMWNNELQWYYSEPEKLNRLDIEADLK